MNGKLIGLWDEGPRSDVVEVEEQDKERERAATEVGAEIDAGTRVVDNHGVEALNNG